jgi:hypothetical protein
MIPTPTHSSSRATSSIQLAVSINFPLYAIDQSVAVSVRQFPADLRVIMPLNGITISIRGWFVSRALRYQLARSLIERRRAAADDDGAVPDAPLPIDKQINFNCALLAMPQGLFRIVNLAHYCRQIRSDEQADD